MTGKIKYQFSTKMWKHAPTGGWHFVSLPKTISKEIRESFGWQEEGWGRMKVIAEYKQHSWKTSIWFDTKAETYVLPIKADIRKKANLQINTKIEMVVWV
ncbi:DUF1905 domain-containing protein [Flavobacteriaceae bacterium S356]|uniref:DUF1905 domain-containing protein n=1 Tax=Asprobacillus argus TaxID=3076534 RepID=A0ABU3LC30_9FLAO|nr:DUF1905 domain-containing protein [Flavobacteriaceae bacterium S356]